MKVNRLSFTMEASAFLGFVAAIAATSLASSAEPAAPVSTHMRISCGGDACGDYAADNYFHGGFTFAEKWPIKKPADDLTPDSVYQHERYGGNFSYSIPVPSLPEGKHFRVRLHFAELSNTAPDKRLENISINGQVVLSNFDVFKEAGSNNTAVIKEFDTISPGKDGTVKIDISVIPGHDDASAEINGIEILGP